MFTIGYQTMDTSGRMDMLGSHGGYDLKGGYVGRLENGHRYRYEVTAYPEKEEESFSVQADLREADRLREGVTGEEVRQVTRKAARERAVARINRDESEAEGALQFRIQATEVSRLLDMIRG